MTLKQRLDQRQIQKLILAPALQQAIKLLPLTNLELTDVIDEELAQNPMLELEEEEDAEKKADPEAETPGDAGGDADRESPEAPEPEQDLPPREPELGTDPDPGFEALFQDYFDDGFRSYSPERKEAISLENFLSRSPSLWDHLNWQADLTFFEEKDKEIAQLIIGNINEDGYLTLPVDDIARQAGVETLAVEDIREEIMLFDPVGAGSLDLKEALTAQMEYLRLKDPITRAIVNEHLPLLEKSDYSQLAKVLNIPLSAIKYHIDIIKGLEPAPGRKYSQDRTSFVVPDIIVSKEEGEFRVSLNNEGLPRLRLNAYYRRLVQSALKDDPEAYRYLKDKMKKALWFLRSLDQRDQTIFKVARYVVDKQKDFFEKGLEYIKPLTLIEIAQEIGVHESTVGRVVANKYLQSPEGVFPLKYFFHKSLAGDFGEEVSSLRVKDKIKKLVEGEDRDNPLSDMEIEDILARQNFRLARRTVAKYRKQLGIPPSHIRKRKSLMEGRP
ncbi:MAG: RNA polymerase factor sigma-54 [Candidatus Aminicenantes bacterium]|nr:RNA polymerase factor sigma-54 [Candidatus Aminicenantes bacterium]